MIHDAVLLLMHVVVKISEFVFISSIYQTAIIFISSIFNSEVIILNFQIKFDPRFRSECEFSAKMKNEDKTYLDINHTKHKVDDV